MSRVRPARQSGRMVMRGVAERPAGLVYRPDLLTSDEEDRLLRSLAGMEVQPVVMHGVASRRQVRPFGVDYDAHSGDVAPPDPIPDDLVALRDRAAAVADVDPASLVEALVTRYPPGATIGW